MTTSVVELQAELALVNTQIEKILESAQDVSNNGKSHSFPELAELRRHRSHLERQIARGGRRRIPVRSASPY